MPPSVHYDNICARRPPWRQWDNVPYPRSNRERQRQWAATSYSGYLFLEAVFLTVGRVRHKIPFLSCNQGSR